MCTKGTHFECVRRAHTLRVSHQARPRCVYCTRTLTFENVGPGSLCYRRPSRRDCERRRRWQGEAVRGSFDRQGRGRQCLGKTNCTLCILVSTSSSFTVSALNKSCSSSCSSSSSSSSLLLLLFQALLRRGNAALRVARKATEHQADWTRIPGTPTGTNTSPGMT